VAVERVNGHANQYNASSAAFTLSSPKSRSLVGSNTRLGDCVSLSMGEWLTLQFSVAAFAGMALAMIVPPVRRSVPRWMEAFIWLGLIVTCWLAITNVQHTNTRFLTESVAWGAKQIVNTAVGLMIGGVLGWISDHRFVIANALVTLVGADILLLALLRSHRKGVGWQPRILLGEWIEVPLHRASAPAPVPVPYALDEWNRRADRATAMLGAAILAGLVQLMIWTRDVVIPQVRARQAQAVTAGRVRAVADLAAKAGDVLDRAALGDANLAMVGPDGVVTDDQLINIRTLLSAQSIGWYGPIVPAPPSLRLVEREGQGSGPDRLAS
jgi:hypothetical protein